MNKVKRRHFLATAAATTATATTLGAPAIAQGRYQWRMVTGWPANFPALGTGAQWLADTIERLSDGRLTIKLYAEDELVPAFEALDAVRSGAAEIGHGAPFYWKGKAPATQFLASTPFGLTAQEQNAWFYFGGGLALAQEVYNDLGCRFFPAGNTGAQISGWFKKKINTLDDFKGLKIRMPGLGAEVLQAAGAIIVNLTGSSIQEALESGTIDAAEWVGPYNDLAFGLHETTSYFYNLAWHEPNVVLDCFINNKAYDDLPKDLQEVLRYSCQATNQWILSSYTANNGRALNTLEDKHGAQMLSYSPEILSGLARLSKQVLNALADQDPMSRRIYDSIIEFRTKALPWSNISQYAYMKAREQAFNRL